MHAVWHAACMNHTLLRLWFLQCKQGGSPWGGSLQVNSLHARSVYGGIHFPKSGPDGQQVGQLVANTVNDNFPASMDAIFGTSFAASSSGSSRGGGGSPVPPASIGRHL